MPIEIKELIIRTTVDTQNRPKNTGSAEECSSPSPANNERLQMDGILELIKNKNER